ncbi:MAG: bile acid:sodium symporter family protein [Comamonas sp.]
MARPRFLPENFTLMMVAAVIIASLLPAAGDVAVAFKTVTTLAIAALFFLHGARLSREAIVAGVTHWRLHLLVLASTFVLFPLLGLLLRPVLSPLVGPALYVGVLYLCVLPSTVQSSIAMVSLARGNIPAAVCSASASTLLGIFVTPVLVGLLVATQGAAVAAGGLEAVGRIVLQLFVPFAAGHLLRPWIGGWVRQRAKMLKVVDQGSVLLVVYTAFSAAVIEGLWHQVSWAKLGGLLLVDAVFLALALGLTTWSARRLGFSKTDQITIVFCGSKKSLASGAPMANVLFSASAVGTILLPLMLYHQMQLMVCAVLAQRFARRPADDPAASND